MKQKLFTFLLALVASVSAIYAQSGTCGSNLTWNLDAETGVLTISGTGAMDNYYYGRVGNKVSPWNDFTSVIKTVIINDGVTSIGEWAFRNCSSLTSVTIPNSVTSIGDSAFKGCSSLTSITIPESVTCIAGGAFYNCSSLTSVTIPNSVTSIGDSAFEGCSSLTSITIPESVTSIGEGAFGLCESLTSITIPNSVTSIEMWTFSACSSLTSVTIGNSVTSIGEQAFASCYSLTSITIPNSVTSIGNYAFYNCSSLISPVYNAHCFAYMPTSYSGAYTIPEGIKQIAGGAFYNCSSLTSITIGNSVTSIGEWAFGNCSSLNSVTVPESVTSIGKSAFEGCSAIDSIVWNAKNCANASSLETAPFYAIRSQITSFTFGENVEHIPAYLCDGMDKLTSVTIPNSVTSIEMWTFLACSSLTSVTIGNSVTSIGTYAFYGCSSLTSITCEAETPPTVGQYAFDGVSKSIPVYVPCGCVETYKAASGWSDFTNIQVPLLEYSIEVYVNDTIMGSAKVDYNTFCEGNQISATPNIGYHFVQWSDGNTENPRTLELTQDTILIAEFAQSFSGQCGDSLYWALVDTTLHITGKGEMYDYKPDSAPWKLLVSSIKVLTIVEDVTKLSQSFDSCSVLESIVWNAKNCADASSLETAPFYAICSQITSFTFGENVEYIPTYLCSGMDKLTSMTIPNSVTSIGSSAFYNCSSLTSITIPDSVTSIGNRAFRNCTSLTSVTIPNSVTSIGDESFSGCDNITSVTWNAKNCNSYNFGSQVTSFEFGNEVEVVPSSLCKGMEKLTSVTIPNSVKTIGTSAFEGCARLGKISLGTGLEEIAANAFAGCTRLYDIYSYATYPPFAEESSFANYNAYLYIPCESKRDYTMDPVWSKFQNIECLSDEPITGVENIDTPSQATTNCEKIIRNGQLLIIRDGVEYTVMGQEL